MYIFNETKANVKQIYCLSFVKNYLKLFRFIIVISFAVLICGGVCEKGKGSEHKIQSSNASNFHD